MLPSGIKRKDLAKHAEVCPLEMVQCPFIEAGCSTRILRKDLNAHMESNSQQHLLKMMTAYSQLKIELSNLTIEHTKLHKEHNNLKLSSQVANLTLVEPVKLTHGHYSFTFNITLSRGLTSPPFSVLDGYTFTIKHKEGRKAILMLLKGKNDDQLKWPMNLPYEVVIHTEEPRRTTPRGRAQLNTPRQIICTVQISDDSVTSVYSREIADIDLPDEVLNYEMIVRLVPTLNCFRCSYCLQTVPGSVSVKFDRCPFCGNMQPS
jgi:hypothetical protein